MRTRAVFRTSLMVGSTALASCKGGGGAYNEAKDALTGATMYTATTQHENDAKTLVGEVVVSCQLPGKQALMTFSSFATSPDGKGTLPAADQLGDRHQARLGDWEPNQLGGIGLYVKEQKFPNTVTWELGESVADYRIHVLEGNALDLKRAASSISNVIRGNGGTPYGVFSFTTRLRRDSADGDWAALVAQADSLRGMILGRPATAVGKYVLALAWDKAVSEARRAAGDSVVTFADADWAGCDHCQRIVAALRPIDDSLRAVLASAKGNAEIQEYERLTPPSNETAGLMAAMTDPSQLVALQAKLASGSRATLPAQPLPSDATLSVQAFLTNRKELVISYEETRGKNVVEVNFTNAAVLKVLGKCK